MKPCLGVLTIHYPEQAAQNQAQLDFLMHVLTSFEVHGYMFDGEGKKKMVTDHRAGKLQIILKNAYGRKNEVEIETWLDEVGIPYVGSGVTATRTGADKNAAKKLFRTAGLSVAKDVLIAPFEWQNQKDMLLRSIQTLGMPVVIKDVVGTDSRGIYMADTLDIARNTIDTMVQAGQTIIVEEYVCPDYEVTCFVAQLATELHAFEPVEVVTGGKVYDGVAKDAQSAHCLVPGRADTQIIQKIKEMSCHAHQVLGCRGFSRADILVRQGHLYLLEVDVHPGFREHSPTTVSVRYESMALDQLFKEMVRPLLQS